MGRWHLEHFSKLKDVKLVAACEVNETLLKKAGADFQIPHLFTDYHQMAEMEGLDAVSIVLPNYLHLPVTITFLESGKDVLVEKPMAMNAREAERMAQKARDKERILMVHMNHRWQPGFTTVKKLVEAGRFGEIYYLKARWHRNRTFDEDQKKRVWFTDKKKAGGGALLDIGVHILDLALWIMDDFEPISVSASVYNKFHSEVDDFASALIRLKGNRLVSLETSWEAHLKDEFSLTVLGTRAGASVSTTSPLLIWEKMDGLTTETICRLPSDLPAEKTSVGHFVSVLKTRKTPETSAEKGVKTMRILDAIYRSAALGKEVKL